MDTDAIVTSIGVVVGSISAIVAIIAVVDARKQRDAAEAAANEARSIQRAIADASHVTATATDRSAAALEAMAHRTKPWSIRRMGRDTMWIVENDLPGAIEIVDVSATDPTDVGSDGVRIQGDMRQGEIIEPGTSRIIGFQSGSAADPWAAKLDVAYRVVGSEEVRHVHELLTR